MTHQANSLDVARYILEKRGLMTAMKLQKLVYYCQVWSLVWDERRLFADKIYAWANGPVVRTLYDSHRGLFKVSADDIPTGDSSKLDPMAKDTINKVLDYYGDKDAQWLSDLTHLELPWQQARKESGLGPGQRGDVEITTASLHEYYSSL